MKYCPNCRQPMDDEAKFCMNCGAAYQDIPKKAYCVMCGTELEPGARFCLNCGAAVAAAAPQMPQQNAPVFTAPAEPEKPKKKGKTGLIVVLILILLAAAAAAACFGLGLFGGDDGEEKPGVSARDQEEEEEEEEEETEETTEETTEEETGETAETETEAETQAPTEEIPTEAPTEESGKDQRSFVYLNELTPTAKTGKLWTRSEADMEAPHHTSADVPGCWSDTETPGHTAGTVVDNQGNTYTYGIHIDGADAKTYSVSFKLDGQYTTFTGICACPAEGSTVGSNVYGKNVYTKYFEVYGDGVLLYSSKGMTRDSAPEYFEIDVTGVTLLTIQYPSTAGPNEIATIYDAKLK